ncbi:MAG TPA: helix-turn-helix transcriptional regulator [Candidatus Egerieousia sp.]|nr:helix-turn-helix transcriptional regulator [Candidatus Egerieousia sp.]HPT06468.1 helix-turn-helix transcriptional regulator [Candidatus Egerieousia sp.]
MKNSIKVERAVLNISQQDLADKIKVSRQTINAIETSRYIPSTVLALKIAAVFHKSVNEIFTLERKD